jgi:hypothetical protein
VSNAIANTSTPTLYQSQRYYNQAMTYQYTVPNGSYTVTLKFAEFYFTAAGKRTFNIVVNGKTVASNYDVFAAAGGAFKAVDQATPVTVTNGAITIQLVPVLDQPMLNALSITTATAPVPPPAPVQAPPPPVASSVVRVNSGGPAYTDPTGNVWAADQSTGTVPYWINTVTTPISGTSTPALYQSQRYYNQTITYQYSVPNGSHIVTLKFADLYFTAAGKRLFNIVINGSTVAANFDVVAKAGGGNASADIQTTVNVTNGTIVIQLVPVLDQVILNAVQIN